MSWKARFLWAFLASIALTVLLALTAIFYDNMPHQQGVLFTSFLFAVHSLAALLGAVLWQRKPARRMVWGGVGGILIGGAVWIALIWLDELDLVEWRGREFIVKVASTLTFPGLVLFVRALLLWPKNRNAPVKWLSILGWGFASIAAGVILSAIWLDDWWGGDGMAKAMGASLILSAGCSVGVFVVARLTQGDMVEHEDSSMVNHAAVRLDCPRCGGSVKVLANTQGKCPGCDLKLRVEFEEPRCKCGYLLHGLTGDTCPECGRMIKDHEAWGGEL